MSEPTQDPPDLDHGDIPLDPEVNPLDALGCRLIVQLRELCDKMVSEELEMQVVVGVLGDLRDTLNRLSAVLKSGPRLTVQGRSFFLSNHPLELDLESFQVAQELRQIWKKLRLGELIFPVQTTEGALLAFSNHLNGALYDIRQAGAFYSTRRADRVRPVPMPKDPRADARTAATHRVIGLYSSVMLLLRRSVEQVQRGDELPLRPMRRAIKELLESMGRHGGLLLGLCYTPEARRWPEAASVATMLHALVVGQLLRLPRRSLLELGLAALLADLGSLGGAAAARRFPLLEEALEDDPDLRQHILALANLINAQGLQLDALSPAVVLHEGADLFSRTDRYSSEGDGLGRHCLYSRIIAVCALYDQLVWPWSLDRAAGDSADEESAAREGEARLVRRVALWNQAIAELDPVVVRTFIEFMGLFPIGTLVVLDTQEVGVVVAQRKGMPDRPLVLTVVDLEQGLRLSGPLVDLAKESERRILCMADAAALGINPVACFRARRRRAGKTHKTPQIPWNWRVDPPGAGR